MSNKSILTTHPIITQTPPSNNLPRVDWDIKKFDGLIWNNGYHAFIEKALRCPCVDKSNGQALSTCQNCLGRGWFFVDKRETRVVSQGMNNIRRNSDIGEINRGVARITTRAIDKLAFMDRIMLLDLEAYYSEIIRPIVYKSELIAYPVYEPIEVTNMYLYIGDNVRLEPIPKELYKISGNKIIFDDGLIESVEVHDMNQKNPDISISIRYSYHPVYHVIDSNRELMRVRERGCGFSDDILKDMPINVLARKAHFIFDAQTFNKELFDNSIV